MVGKQRGTPYQKGGLQCITPWICDSSLNYITQIQSRHAYTSVKFVALFRERVKGNVLFEIAWFQLRDHLSCFLT